MTPIEVVRSIIMQFPDIDQFTNGVHYEFTEYSENDNENAGLFSVGDTKTGEDILGNQRRRNDLILYANCQSINDYERLANSSFISNLAFYLDNIKCEDYKVTIGAKGQEKSGTLKQIACANGMLYRYLEETQTGPVQYQLQIAITYIIYD